MSGSESGNEVHEKHDPDGTRMLARCLDKLDGVLVQHGFQFKDDCVWENFAEELQNLLYRHYDDLTGGDSSYDPNAPESDSGEEDEETPSSETLDSSSSESPIIKNKKSKK